MASTLSQKIETQSKEPKLPWYQNPFLWVVVGAFLLFTLNAWSYPLFDVDEPRYTETAREILTGGDWITPHFNYLKRFDKPIFYYWLIAGVFQLIGITEFAGRLVSALSATAIIAGVYCVTLQFMNRKTAIIISVVMATCLEFLMLARWAVTDMTLVCFMSLAAIGLFLGIEKNWRYFLLAGVSAGFGLLTKGPVALVLPGAIAVLYTLVFNTKQWQWLRHYGLYLGVLIAIVIALPWYYLVHTANPSEFFENFFLLHNVERFRSTVSSHSGPWYYYFIVLAIGGLPWSLLIPAQLITIKTFWAWLSQKSVYKKWFAFCLTWFVATFILFSVAQTKLLTYLLFAFPAYTVLLGIWLFWLISQTQFLPKAKQQFQQVLLLLPFSLLTLGLLALFAFSIWLFHAPDFQVLPLVKSIVDIKKHFNPLGIYTALTLMSLTTLLVCWAIFKNQLELALKRASVGAVLSLVVVFMFVLPSVSQLLNGDVQQYALLAKQDNATLATFRLKRPSMVFYYQGKVYYLPPKDELEHLPKQTPETLYFSKQPVYLVARTKDLERLEAVYPFKVKQRGFYFSLVVPNNPRQLPLRKDVNQ